MISFPVRYVQHDDVRPRRVVVGQPRERDGDGMPGDADLDVAHAGPGFSPVQLVSAGAGANHPIESSGSGVGAGGMEVASDRY
ncbi:hypothetical protein GS580_27350 [Rhodococcus hoagii]|nr:hypothetical protein [Prescottella equi]